MLASALKFFSKYAARNVFALTFSLSAAEFSFLQIVFFTILFVCKIVHYPCNVCKPTITIFKSIKYFLNMFRHLYVCLLSAHTEWVQDEVLHAVCTYSSGRYIIK